MATVYQLDIIPEYHCFYFSHKDTEKGKIVQILPELLLDPGVEIHSLDFELNILSTSLSSFLTKVWKHRLFHLFQTRVH